MRFALIAGPAGVVFYKIWSSIDTENQLDGMIIRLVQALGSARYYYHPTHPKTLGSKFPNKNTGIRGNTSLVIRGPDSSEGIGGRGTNGGMCPLQLQ
jgi:hypothetical protein